MGDGLLLTSSGCKVDILLKLNLPPNPAAPYLGDAPGDLWDFLVLNEAGEKDTRGETLLPPYPAVGLVAPCSP